MRKHNMKRYLFVVFLSIAVACSMNPYCGTVFAEDKGDISDIQISYKGFHFDPEEGKGPVRASKDKTEGDKIIIKANTTATSGSEDYYLTQIRACYKNRNNKDVYRTIKTYRDFSGDEITAGFTIPDDSKDGKIKICSDYVSVVWDGTVDLTWYDPEKKSYDIKYAAQWAGAAALCNGLFNDIPTRQIQTKDGNGKAVTADIPDLTDKNGKKVSLLSGNECVTNGEYNGNYAEGTISDKDGSGYQIFADNDSDGYDTAVVGDLSLLKIRNSTTDNSGSNNVFTTSTFWFGPESYTGKTVNLIRDIDMGGILKRGARKTDPRKWSGPNYMPAGGGYVMDPNNGYTKTGSGFNGKLNGHGHIVKNIYAMRHVSTGEFGNSQFTGFVGLLGSYNTKLVPKDDPVIENVAVDGFIYGNRMVGGITGETYHSNRLEIRNCLNFATVYNTDAKGCAGIAGSGIHDVSLGDPQPVIRNCANFGYICTGYNKGAAGLVGYSEALVYDSYNVGYVGHDGKGEHESAQSLGTNNGGAVWYNVYALKGSSWHALAGADNIPGTKTPEVRGSTIGSAIMSGKSPEDFKSSTFLGMLNGKVKSNGTDKNGYLISDDSVLKNTKRNWTRGEEENDKVFISDNVKTALENIQSWHDPKVVYKDFKGFGVSDVAMKLSDLNASGMPVPITFMKDNARFTGISYTGTPNRDYLEGERFDTGNHSRQSPGPDKDKPDSDSEFTIWANYSDGSFAEITDYDVTYQHGGDSFRSGDKTVSLTAEFNGERFVKQFDVTVTPSKLLSIEVDPPANTLYAQNECFNTTGMTVTTKYGSDQKTIMAVKTVWKDGHPSVRQSKNPVKDSSGNTIFPGNSYEQVPDETAAAFVYTISPDVKTRLTPDIKKVTVSHTFAGVTMSKDVEIRVLEGEAPVIHKDSDNNWSVEIDSEDDFIWFANKVNTREKQDLNATLLKDIRITDSDFEPVGLYRGKTIQYTGGFNGNGNSVILDLERHGKPAALFYNIGTGGKVRDLIIEGSVTGGTGNVDGDISINDSFNAVSSVAVALNGGTIEKCINKADIKADEQVHAGGIAGELKGGNITGCTNEGNITGGNFYSGGITGILRTGVIVSSLNTGRIQSTGAGNAGGIAGSLTAGSSGLSLKDCFNTGKVQVKSGEEMSAAGGIAGSIYNTGKSTKIEGCCNAGVIIRENEKTDKGALIGSAPKLTGAQIVNAGNNIALTGTSALLIGKVPSVLEGAISGKKFCFSDDIADAFKAKGLSDEYNKALTDIAEYGSEPEMKLRIKGKNISLSGSKFVYTGREIKPAVKVKGLFDGTDFTVSYSGNKAIGAAKAVITGKGSYEGCVTKKFVIVPQKITGLKLTAGKKRLTVRFKKAAGGVKYQIAYRKKGMKKWITRKVPNDTLSIRNLNSKKQYQVKVRSFRIVKSKTYYSKWSSVKKMKVK